MQIISKLFEFLVHVFSRGSGTFTLNYTFQLTFTVLEIQLDWQTNRHSSICYPLSTESLQSFNNITIVISNKKWVLLAIVDMQWSFKPALTLNASALNYFLLKLQQRWCIKLHCIFICYFQANVLLNLRRLMEVYIK